jgi:hypothetical protein
MRILFVVALYIGAGLLITNLLATGLSNWRTSGRNGEPQVARVTVPDATPWQPIHKEIAP